MSAHFIIVHTCPDCGEEIKEHCMDLSNEIPHISSSVFEQVSFTCDECDKEYYTGDLEVYSDDE